MILVPVTTVLTVGFAALSGLAGQLISLTAAFAGIAAACRRLAAAAIVTLLLTQDFSGLKVIFDKWTMLMAAYPLAGGLMGAIAGVREDKKAK